MERLLVKKDSWHYRLIGFMYNNPLWGEDYSWRPRGLAKVKNLCMYGRRLIVAVVFFLPLAIYLIPGFIVAKLASYHVDEFWAKPIGWGAQIYGTLAVTYPILDGFWHSYSKPELAPSWLAGVSLLWYAILASAVIVTLSGIAVYIQDWYTETHPKPVGRDHGRKKHRVREAYEASTLKLIFAWLMAKKAKICPVIHFVD